MNDRAYTIHDVMMAASLLDIEEKTFDALAELLENRGKTPTILVDIEAGRVRKVSTNLSPAVIVVADYDHDGIPDAELYTVWQGKAGSTRQAAFCRQTNEPLTEHFRDLVEYFLYNTQEDTS